MYNKKRLNAQLTAYLLSFTLAFSTAGGASSVLASDADERASIDATQTLSASEENERGEVSAMDNGAAVIPQNTPSAAPSSDQAQPATQTPQESAAASEDRGSQISAVPAQAVPVQSPVDTAVPAQTVETPEQIQQTTPVSDDYEITVDGNAVTSVSPSAALEQIAPALGGDSISLVDAATLLRTRLGASDMTSSVISALKAGTCLVVSTAASDSARYLITVSGKTIALTTAVGELCQVQFDANGGAVEGESVHTIFKGDAFSGFAKATRDGYQFAGWFYGPQDDVARAYETDLIPQGTTLYAHWTNGSVNTITYKFGYTRSGSQEDFTLTEAYAVQDGLYSVGRFPTLNVYGYVINAWVNEKGQVISGTQMSGNETVSASWANNAAPATPAMAEMAAAEESASNEVSLLQAASGNVTVNFGEDATPAGLTTVNVSTEEDYYTLADVKEALKVSMGNDWPEDDKPTREGYTFTGWKYESGSESGEVADLTDTTAQFTEDLTLTAQWQKETGPVTVKCGDSKNDIYMGDTIEGSEEPVKTTETTDLLETLSAASAYFSEEPVDLSTAKADYIEAKDIAGEDEEDSYTAKVRVPLASGATASEALASAADQGELILYDSEKEIMRLKVTKSDDDSYVIEKIPSSEYTTYKVTYDANYEGADPINVVGYRTSSETLSYYDAEAPERDGYVFMGWYYVYTTTDEEDPDAEAAVSEEEALISDYITQDTVLYAMWCSDKAKDVIYNMNDASFTEDNNDTEVTFKTLVYGKNAMNDAEIVADQYASGDGTSVFSGWYTAKEGGEEITGQDFTEDITTVYAHWKQSLTLTFFDDDETSFYYIDPIAGAEGEALHDTLGSDFSLEKPNAKVGYAFVGWFTAPEGGEQVTEDTTLTADMAEGNTIKLYAHWFRGAYTITYDPDGGTFSDGTTEPKTAVIQGGDTLGDVPTTAKEGYNFKGWFDEEGNEALSNTEPTADTTYTAKWEQRAIVLASVTLPKHSMTINSVDELDTLFKDFVYAPEDASNATFKWSSSDPSIISVTDTAAKDKSTWASGSTPFAIGEDGTAVITIEAEDGTVKDSCTVTLKKVTTVDSIDIYRNSTEKVTGSTIEVEYGDDLKLSKVFNPSTAEEGIDGTWSSSDPNVLTAPDKDDEFTYKGVGTTVLTFTNSEGVSASVTVVVKENDQINEEHSVRTLAYVVPGTETVHIGDPVNLNIIYTPMTDVHNATFVWTTDNPDVLNVASDGRNANYSYGGSTGTAHITVATEDGTIHAVKTIVVVEKDSVDWTPDKKTYYTVSFETFGGSEIPDESVEAFNSAVLPTPTKEGFVFDGWYLDNSFTGEPVTTLVPTADTILYAHWVEDPNLPAVYTITFEPQNGEKATQISYQEGSMLGAFPEVTYEGYRLIGWFTADEGGEEVTASTLVTEDRAYYAHWVNMEKEGRYILTLDPNGGILDDSAKASVMQPDLVVGKGYWNDVSSEIPTMPGHKFIGYFDAKEGGNMVYGADGLAVKGSAYFDADGNFIGSADLNVFAQWEETAEKFVLDFDSRGGSKVDPIVYDYNTTATDFPTPTREGWTFLGWFEHATAGEPITSILIDTNKTIYAQWEKNPTEPVVKDNYTVTFDSQGGSAVDPVTVQPGESVELPEPTKDGYTFLGWYDAPTGGNHVTSMTPQDDVTLYAHWAKEKIVTKTFTITFDFQDGNKETISGSVYDDGTSDTLTNFPVAEKERAEFEGWFTAKKGGVKVRSYSGDNDITLYAHFTESSSEGETPEVLTDYTITFDSQGGSEVSSITDKEGTSVKDFETPTREGYKFLGWYTASDSGNLVYSVILKKDVTLYAHWAVEAEKTYTVILDKQDGTSGSTYTMKVGETFTLPAATREGYTFDGWFTSPTGGSRTTTYNGIEGSITTFYAQWTKAAEEKVLVKKITLNKHELTITKGQGLGLSYTYSPKHASNASFTWSSSNPDVLAVITKVGEDGSTTQSLKVKSAGEATLTISTTDGTVSDSCKITIKEAADSSTKTGSDGTADNTSENAGSNGSSGNASTPSSSGTTADATTQKYVLTLVSTTGSAQKVTVKGSVTLDALATKLGYTVGSYGLKTASNTTEAALDKNTTMASLASTGSTGDMLLIAYDASGSAMGSAKISKTADGAFTVTLSKGTTATLNKYADGGTSGSSSDSTTSLSGKSSTTATTGTSTGSATTATADGKGGAQVVANPSKTGDPMRYTTPIMVLLGGLFLSLTALRKRKNR